MELLACVSKASLPSPVASRVLAPVRGAVRPQGGDGLVYGCADEGEEIFPVSFEFMHGHAMDVLKNIPDNTYHCIVTSVPYWGLRDYQTPPVIMGGDPECAHEFIDEHVENEMRKGLGLAKLGEQYRGGGHKIGAVGKVKIVRGFCAKCGAWRGSLGLEPTLELYIEHMVIIFHELRRVLRKDGTCWLNIGDTYWGGKGQSGSQGAEFQQRRVESGASFTSPASHVGGSGKTRPQDGKHKTLKPKDLCGIPWKLAFALQDDGWWLRRDIIWHKQNCMPESASDRPTTSHEYIFLLTKSAKYFYDAEAVAEEVSPNTHMRISQDLANQIASFRANGGSKINDPMKAVVRGSTRKLAVAGLGIKNNGSFEAANSMPVSKRNRRSVWTIATEPYSGAHFAVFPQEIPRIAILAGTSERGCCPKCGAPWERVMSEGFTDHSGKTECAYEDGSTAKRMSQLRQAARANGGEYVNMATTIGWKPTCGCDEVAEPIPCSVLDPFSGSGTTVAVAHKLQRHGVGIELSKEYIKLANRRMEKAGILL